MYGPPSLKVMIDKQKSKVLFAEANSDVVDVLLSFLTLPLGKMVRILEKHYGSKAPVIGSLTTLHKGLSNLDSTHFCVGGAKEMLLNPTSSFEVEWRRLKLDFTHSQSPTKRKYFVCQDAGCREPGYKNISMYHDVAKCDCGEPLTRETVVAGEPPVRDGDGGFITVSALAFIITDDLRIAPVVTGFVQTLNNLGIKDIDGAELKSLRFGITDVMDLLKFSLTSSTPLTSLIMRDTAEKIFTAAQPEPGILFHHFVKESRKMILKISLQKSTNKFLFAQATDEFVEFLLSFLTVPLGGVESLLGGNTCFKNIVNLSKSVSDFIDHKYFRTPDTKKRLINPKLAHGYINKNLFLPLTSEDTPPELYYKIERGYFLREESVFNEKGDGSLVPSFKSSIKDHENYVKKHAMCFVTDDLTVSPSMVPIISTLIGLGISLSDVKEMELQIGMEEVLAILKAALSSTTALTDTIVNPCSTNYQNYNTCPSKNAESFFLLQL